MKNLLRLTAVLAIISVVVVYSAIHREQMRLELKQAVLRGDLAAVRDLLSRGATQPYIPNEPAPLAMAIEGHRDDIAIALIRAGARVVPKQVICQAVMRKNPVVLAELLKQSYDLNQPCVGDGFTAIMLAGDKGNVEVASLLLENGADPNQECAGRDFHGDTAVTRAVIAQNTHVLNLLLERGGNPNTSGNPESRLTPLMLAARIPFLDGVRLLLAHGANVDAKDKLGYTARRHAELALRNGTREPFPGARTRGWRPPDLNRLREVIGMLRDAELQAEVGSRSIGAKP